MKRHLPAVLLICASVAVSCRDSETRREMIASPLMEETIRRADEALKAEPLTITAFPAERSAGGIHDFYSEADYSWPDPKDPDAPYIGRDGYSYPGLYDEHRAVLLRLCNVVSDLTCAWILTGDMKYAEAVEPHLMAWFVNEDTMMAPNMLYAQAVRNKFTGRCYGVIDAVHLVEVVQSMIKLEEAGILSEGCLEKTKSWFYQFADWMWSDPQGVTEMHTGNNHGVCWILQVGMYAKYCGWEEMFHFCQNRFMYKYLPEMAPDGSFPMETARTKSYGYSIFDLDAMVGVCQALSTPECDLFAFKASNGNTIRMAMDFLYPYIKDKSNWPFGKDVTHWDDWPVAQPFMIFAWNRFRGDRDFPADDYYDTWLGLDHFPTDKEVIRNLPMRHPILWIY